MSKTLEELDDEDWGEPNYPSHLVTAVHRLRRKPLGEFTTEDLRIMIGQNLGLKHLLPHAMEILRENPLASGDFYDGDLLLAVLRCEAVENPGGEALRNELTTFCLRALQECEKGVTEELFAGHPPSEFGLTDEAADQLLREKIQQAKRETPWREIQESLLRLGKA